MGHWENTKYKFPWVAYIFWRIAQFALGLTACGLYGVDLTNAAARDKPADAKWVFAEVTAILSVFTAMAYWIVVWLEYRRDKELFTYHRYHPDFPVYGAWDLILFIMWLTVFSIFASMYITEDPEGDNGIQRMKNAVWVDLANWLLWLGSATGLGWLWWISGDRSMWTGGSYI